MGSMLYNTYLQLLRLYAKIIKYISTERSNVLLSGKKKNVSAFHIIIPLVNTINIS